jgi:hypothetical protein
MGRCWGEVTCAFVPRLLDDNGPMCVRARCLMAPATSPAARRPWSCGAVTGTATWRRISRRIWPVVGGPVGWQNMTVMPRSEPL